MARMMAAATGLALGLLMVSVSATVPAQAADRKITCSQGLKIVKHSRFADVRVSDCKGNTYTYSGRRSDAIYLIDISSRTGKIRRTKRTFINQ